MVSYGAENLGSGTVKNLREPSREWIEIAAEQLDPFLCGLSPTHSISASDTRS